MSFQWKIIVYLKFFVTAVQRVASCLFWFDHFKCYTHALHFLSIKEKWRINYKSKSFCCKIGWSSRSNMSASLLWFAWHAKVLPAARLHESQACPHKIDSGNYDGLEVCQWNLGKNFDLNYICLPHLEVEIITWILAIQIHSIVEHFAWTHFPTYSTSSFFMCFRIFRSQIK